MPKFTEQQQAAIEHHGHHILVSASAGSGKTTVLVKRIIEEVLQGVDLDSLLVVTFTDAAAAEMRERVRDSLIRAIADTTERAEGQRLRQQLNLLATAQISTLHSFCLKVIRKFYYLLDLDPNFRLLTDGTERQLIKEQTWANLRDRHYDQQDEAFFELADQFGSDRSDQGLQDAVFQLYAFAITRPNTITWLSHLVSQYQIEDNLDSSPYYQAFIRPELMTQLAQLRLEIQALQDLLPQITDTDDKIGQLCAQDLAALAPLFDERTSQATYAQISTALEQLEFPSRFVMTGKKYEQELSERATFKLHLNQVKDDFKDLQAHFFMAPEELLVATQKKAAGIMTTLTSITQEFIHDYAQDKRRIKALDFNDLEQLTFELFNHEKDNERPVQVYYRQFIHEVLVDEYQDINPLQEAILQAVAQPTPGNMFMVGDVKQSIYGFRQADPSKFLEKYQQFRSEDNSGERIVLAENFRSTPNINESTNFLFQQFMHHDLAELDYGQDEKLVTGAKDYPDDLETTTEVLLYESKPASDTQETTTDADTPTTTSSTAVVPMGNAEARIKILADRIEALIREPYLIYDRDAKIKRPITYRDIAILVPTRGDNLAVISEMQQRSLPIYVKDANDYFQTTEVQVMLSLMEIINNPEQDIPLVTVLRSPIGQFDENDLAQIRSTNKSVNFYTALMLTQAPENASLHQKVSKFLELLAHLRAFAVQHSIAELVWECYQQTGYLDYVGGMPGGLQRSLNLYALYQRAFSYEQTSFRGLYQFIDFIKEMQAHNQDLAQAQVGAGGEDALQLMTIHGSKGLEFPVVFVLNLDHKFNQDDISKSKIVLDGHYGAGIKYIDFDRRLKYPTLIDNFIRARRQQASVAEEMRLLYVAMTRAKQKLIMIGAVDNFEKTLTDNQVIDEHRQLLLPVKFRKPNKIKSFLQLILPALLRANQLTILSQHQSSEGTDSTPLVTNAKFAIRCYHQEELLKSSVPTPQDTTEKVPMTPLDAKLKSTIEQLLDFDYPYQTATRTTAYQSVSEIKQAFTDPDQFQLSFLPLSLNLTQPAATIKDQAPIRLQTQSSRLFADDFPQPAFLTEQQEVTGAQVGTATHLLLQRIDLNQYVTRDYLAHLVQQLTTQSLIQPEVAAKIDLDAVLDFFQSSLGQQLQAPENSVYREVAFSLLLPAQAIFEMPDEPDVQNLLVHGIMDGYVINRDELILFDYKTDHLDRHHVNEARLHQLIEKYRGQLNLYEEALSNMLQRPVTHKFLYFLSANRLVEL